MEGINQSFYEDISYKIVILINYRQFLYQHCIFNSSWEHYYYSVYLY